MKEKLDTFEKIRDYIIEEYNKKYPNNKVSLEEMIEGEYPIEELAENFKLVDSTFEDGGRWSNWYICVYNIGDRYIKVESEKPASEIQEGMYLDVILSEVYPIEKTITVYE